MDKTPISSAIHTNAWACGMMNKKERATRAVDEKTKNVNGSKNKKEQKKNARSEIGNE